MKIILFVSSLIAVVFMMLLTACTQTTNIDKSYCKSDDDCICGGFDTRNDVCFIGNKDYYNKYVNTTRQCSDFCGGIAGNLETACIKNQCRQINSGYCDVDSDCVRQSSCCDCGLGHYVNKKYYHDVECTGPRCMCATQNSIGKCVDNQCIAVTGEII